MRDTVAALVPLHLGPLHPIEQALTVLLAFGPFVLLGIVVVVRRRQDQRAEASEASEAAETAEAAPSVEEPREADQRER